MPNEKPNILKTRERLEESKFFLKEMEKNLKNRTDFQHFLDAFLASARSVFHVFEKEFSGNEQLLRFGKETEKIPIIKFFRKLRNISLKEYTPETKKKIEFIMASKFNFTEKDIRKVVDDEGKTHYVSPLVPLELKETKHVGYVFDHDFRWFNENPDVISLCTEYINELEKFVRNVELMLIK